MRPAYLMTAAILISMCGHASAQESPELAVALAAHDSHNYDLAYDLLLPLAEAGDSTAQSKIAHMYYWGEGRPVDHTQHFEWSLRSAENGNPIGQFDVATDYFVGRGVAQDPKAGLKWTLLAAEGGEEYAQLAMAVRYLTGDGTPLDPVLGSHYLELATDQNEPRALAFAAWAHVFGEVGLEADFDKGIALLKRAAEHHHAGAQMSYGIHLVSKARSDEDMTEALKWLTLSEMVGCEKAAAALIPLRARVGEDVASLAVEQAEQWLAAQPARAPHDHRNYKAAFCDTAPLLNAETIPGRNIGGETTRLAVATYASPP